MAPRSLITVLLFLTVRDSLPLPDYLGGAVLPLVLSSSLLMLLSRTVRVMPSPEHVKELRNL